MAMLAMASYMPTSLCTLNITYYAPQKARAIDICPFIVQDHIKSSYFYVQVALQSCAHARFCAH